MPKTLLFNWEKELETFTELTILRYDGPKRSSDSILFTTTSFYVHTPAFVDKTIKSQKFELMILDEAQYVKNHTTNTFKAIKKIAAQQHLL